MKFKSQSQHHVHLNIPNHNFMKIFKLLQINFKLISVFIENISGEDGAEVLEGTQNILLHSDDGKQYLGGIKVPNTSSRCNTHISIYSAFSFFLIPKCLKLLRKVVSTRSLWTYELTCINDSLKRMIASRRRGYFW